MQRNAFFYVPYDGEVEHPETIYYNYFRTIDKNATRHLMPVVCGTDDILFWLTALRIPLLTHKAQVFPEFEPKAFTQEACVLPIPCELVGRICSGFVLNDTQQCRTASKGGAITKC